MHIGSYWIIPSCSYVLRFITKVYRKWFNIVRYLKHQGKFKASYHLTFCMSSVEQSHRLTYKILSFFSFFHYTYMYFMYNKKTQNLFQVHTYKRQHINIIVIKCRKHINFKEMIQRWSCQYFNYYLQVIINSLAQYHLPTDLTILDNFQKKCESRNSRITQEFGRHHEKESPSLRIDSRNQHEIASKKNFKIQYLELITAETTGKLLPKKFQKIVLRIHNSTLYLHKEIQRGIGAI